MEWISPDLTVELLLIASAVAVFAGLIKGIVGFAMPTIFVAGLGFFVDPQLALAGLILPTLVTNGYQALRQGRRAAVQSIKKFRVFLISGGVFLLCSAQLVTVLDDRILLMMIGVPVTGFAIIQLFGLQLFPPTSRSSGSEATVGAFAGFLGGFSGIWGPPTVAYLTALNTKKRDQIRIQGVIYGLGALALFFAHLLSGVLRQDTIWFSAILIVPGMLGMWLGTQVQDKIDQRRFQKLTLVVLVFAGLNLLRKALLG